MATKRIPKLRKHKPSEFGVVTINGVDHYLGKWLAKQKKPPQEVQAAYDAFIAEWLAGCHHIPSEKDKLAMSELILAWMKHAESHYRRQDGSETCEVGEYKMTLRAVNYLYGSRSAAEFTPRKLKAVRQVMIDGYEHPKYGKQVAVSRGGANRRASRIVRVFKWAVSEELVSATVWQELTAVEGLEAGRTTAKETDPVEPVAVEIVEKTLLFQSEMNRRNSLVEKSLRQKFAFSSCGNGWGRLTRGGPLQCRSEQLKRFRERISASRCEECSRSTFL